MGKLPHITESEWAIISILWEEAPLTAAQIVERVQVDKNLANTTIRTLLRRLVAKEASDLSDEEIDSLKETLNKKKENLNG